MESRQDIRFVQPGASDVHFVEGTLVPLVGKVELHFSEASTEGGQSKTRQYQKSLTILPQGERRTIEGKRVCFTPLDIWIEEGQYTQTAWVREPLMMISFKDETVCLHIRSRNTEHMKFKIHMLDISSHGGTWKFFDTANILPGGTWKKKLVFPRVNDELFLKFPEPWNVVRLIRECNGMRWEGGSPEAGW